MGKKHVTFEYQGAEVKLPLKTIIKHWLEKHVGVGVTTVESAPAVPQLEWSATLLDGEAVTYEKAQAAVKALGPGWRIPTRQELASLVDITRHDPAIDVTKYPDTKSRAYWTQDECSWNKSAVWVVLFSFGNVYYYLRSYDACLRACRSLPASQ